MKSQDSEVSIEEKKKIERPRKIEIKKRVCVECSKDFDLLYSDRGGIFCSHKCFVSFSRKNSTNYRIKAFALLPNECFYCQENDKSKLVVHHIDKNFLNNDIENLQILCNSCHRKQHKEDNSRFKKFKEAQILRGLRMILDGLRVNLKDENFKGTPERVLRSFYEIYSGQGADLQEQIKQIFSTSFPSDYSGMVMVKDIKCFSTCPHHLRDIEYSVDVGYISTKGKMLGLSKIARLVEILAQRLVLQETFTHDIVKYMMKFLQPEGVMVVVKGKHNCMRMRGIKNPDALTTTSSVEGIYKTDVAARQEFLSLTKLP